jgi:hypothetical protein
VEHFVLRPAAWIHTMEGTGPVVSMQSTSAHLYSKERLLDYHGDFLSHQFPSDDFLWETPKQKPIETATAVVDLGPPLFESGEDSMHYGYTTNSGIPGSKNASGMQPASNGLRLPYDTNENYSSFMSDTLSNNQAVPQSFDTGDTGDTLNSVEYQFNTEQHSQDVAIGNGLGFQNAHGDGAGDFPLAYGSSVDYTSAQVAPSSDICVRPQYNDACELASTPVSYTTSLPMPEIGCQRPSVTWSPNIGENLDNQIQSSSDVNPVLRITNQSFSIQSEPPWDVAEGGFCSHDPTLFDNAGVPLEGSPFENSPLSSTNGTPLVTQSTWADEHSTNFTGVEGDLAWQNRLVQQISPIEDMTISAPTGAQPMADGRATPLKIQYQSLVSVIQVGIKSELESPPADYPPRMDDLIVNFDSSPNAASRKRKRTKFTPEGAEKVRSVRNKGACVACHYRKTPVVTCIVS